MITIGEYIEEKQPLILGMLSFKYFNSANNNKFVVATKEFERIAKNRLPFARSLSFVELKKTMETPPGFERRKAK